MMRYRPETSRTAPPATAHYIIPNPALQLLQFCHQDKHMNGSVPQGAQNRSCVCPVLSRTPFTFRTFVINFLSFHLKKAFGMPIYKIYIVHRREDFSVFLMFLSRQHPPPKKGGYSLVFYYRKINMTGCGRRLGQSMRGIG